MMTSAFTTLGFLIGIGGASLANAKPVYFSQLQGAFPGAPLSQRCNVCHTNQGARLNLFGNDFARLKRQHGHTNLSTVWRELRVLDSNGDGESNEADINSGRNPGVARPAP